VPEESLFGQGLVEHAAPLSMNSTESRLPTALEAAIGHVKETTFATAERVASGLGTQAQSSTRVAERDLLLTAQIDLRRKMNAFHLTFTKQLIDKIQADIAPRQDSRRNLATDWQSLSLVGDQEVEERMFSGRIGQQISHACEWELRETAAYMAAVLKFDRTDEERNPLRADVIGMALFRAIEAVTADSDSRKLLAREFGHAMAQAMPKCYASIVSDMQLRNVQPLGLTVKTADGGGHTGYSSTSMRDEMSSTRSPPGEFRGSTPSGFASGHGTSGMSNMQRGGAPTQPAPFQGSGYARTGGGGAPTMPAGFPTAGGGGRAGVSSEADAQLMALLRRLTFLASRPGVQDIAPATQAGGFSTTSGREQRGVLSLHGDIGGPMDAGASGAEQSGGMPGLMAVNLIRAHRDELVQASSGKLDHMVIDVVGSLFDQILSDPKVPPQMARQIARLQLPVLRVALVDSTFFSSRRHPVRRFVNRIASLACAFDDFDDGPGKQFIDRVKDLVQQIVEGDFDQLELYTAKLTELERFISGQTENDAKLRGTATVLESKESELRVQQRYMQQLSAALSGISMPEYMREFVAQVWSQALVLAARRHGADADIVKRFRIVGRDLVMSVQPKGSPILRKRFLMQLPTLMKDLNEGL
jgi:hypothetical protein